MSVPVPSLGAGERVRAASAQLGVAVPLVQAGMGGVAGPELAAAVSSAGALGTVGLYRSPAPLCRDLVREVMSLTSFPFGINVIPEVAGEKLLAEQLHSVLDATDRRLVVNVYGQSPVDLPETVRSAGHVIAVQLGGVHELVDADADVLIAQGSEAGGHHLGTSPLLPLLRAVAAARPNTPLLAAGGIGTASSVAAAVWSGAWGVQVGTAFVATRESRAHPQYQQRLVDARAEDTCISDRFDFGWSGRRHRVLRNGVTAADTTPTPDFIAVSVGVDGRRQPIPRGSANVPTSTTAGAIDDMALYAGTDVGAVVDVPPAAEVVARLRGPLSGAHAEESPVPVRAAIADRGHHPTPQGAP